MLSAGKPLSYFSVVLLSGSEFEWLLSNSSHAQIHHQRSQTNTLEWLALILSESYRYFCSPHSTKPNSSEERHFRHFPEHLFPHHVWLWWWSLCFSLSLSLSSFFDVLSLLNISFSVRHTVNVLRFARLFTSASVNILWLTRLLRCYLFTLL